MLEHGRGVLANRSFNGVDALACAKYLVELGNGGVIIHGQIRPVQIVNIETGKTELIEFRLVGGLTAYADNVMDAGGLAVFLFKLLCALHIKLAANEGLFNTCLGEQLRCLCHKGGART